MAGKMSSLSQEKSWSCMGTEGGLSCVRLSRLPLLSKVLVFIAQHKTQTVVVWFGYAMNVGVCTLYFKM